MSSDESSSSEESSDEGGGVWRPSYEPEPEPEPQRFWSPPEPTERCEQPFASWHSCVVQPGGGVVGIGKKAHGPGVLLQGREGHGPDMAGSERASNRASNRASTATPISRLRMPRRTPPQMPTPKP